MHYSLHLGTYNASTLLPLPTCNMHALFIWLHAIHALTLFYLATCNTYTHSLSGYMQYMHSLFFSGYMQFMHSHFSTWLQAIPTLTLYLATCNTCTHSLSGYMQYMHSLLFIWLHAIHALTLFYLATCPLWLWSLCIYLNVSTACI